MPKKNQPKTVREMAIEDRLCVRLGLADSVPGRNGIRYNWVEIERHWEGWPTADLREFCRHYQLSYASITGSRGQHGLSVARKTESLSRQRRTYRDLVLARMAVARISDLAADSRHLSRICDDLQETAAVLAKQCKARLAKQRPDGALVPNLRVDSREVKRLADTMGKVAMTLAVVADIRRVDPGTGRQRELVKPVPKLLPPSPSAKVAALTGGPDGEDDSDPAAQARHP